MDQHLLGPPHISLRLSDPDDLYGSFVIRLIELIRSNDETIFIKRGKHHFIRINVVSDTIVLLCLMRRSDLYVCAFNAGLERVHKFNDIPEFDAHESWKLGCGSDYGSITEGLRNESIFKIDWSKLSMAVQNIRHHLVTSKMDVVQTSRELRAGIFRIIMLVAEGVRSTNLKNALIHYRRIGIESPMDYDVARYLVNFWQTSSNVARLAAANTAWRDLNEGERGLLKVLLNVNYVTADAVKLARGHPKVCRMILGILCNHLDGN